MFGFTVIPYFSAFTVLLERERERERETNVYEFAV